VVPTTAASVGPSEAVVDRATAPFATLVRPEPTVRVHGPLDAPPPARPAIDADAAPQVADDTTPGPTLPVEPSVRVSAAHLVDPVGLRVVPFRPDPRWPLRRAAPRILDPFRGFPMRSAHLADLIDGSVPRR
jgi:hypothetical protein